MPHALRLTLIIVGFIAILCAVAVAIAAFLFNRQADREVLQLLGPANKHQEIVQQSDLDGLPVGVQKWLERSGAVGKERIHTVRIVQTGRMRTEEGQPWMPVEAVHYANIDRPGFLWKAEVKAAPLVTLLGKDRYYQGEGSMLISLLGLFPVVKTQSCEEINQSTLVRFLAEIVWYPTAALNDYIEWEEIDAHSARATMAWQGTRASMVYTFNEQGDMVGSIAPRYREAEGKYVLDDWGGLARGYREFNGRRIQNKIDVVWKYKTGDFNWLQIEVLNIDFNQPGI